MPDTRKPGPLYGFTAADFDGSKAVGKGERFKTGQRWRNATAMSGGIKGGSGARPSMAQSSAATSAAFQRGSAQRTAQFIGGGRSAGFTGTRGYRGFTAARSLAGSVNATLANARKASVDQTRQNIARQASNVATGGRGYRITRTPQSLQQGIARTLANARKASVDLSRQSRAHQASNVATGGRRWGITRTPQSLRGAVEATLSAARRVSPQNNALLRSRGAANRFSGTPGAMRQAGARGHTPRPTARQSEEARQARQLLAHIRSQTRLHPASAARWQQAQAWARSQLERLAQV